jgi:predicted nucleic acid-binding protein
VAENWILNASPLIALARIGREDLILAQANKVVVPQAVAREIQAGPAEDRAR